MGRGGVGRTGGAPAAFEMRTPAVMIRDRTGMMDGPEPRLGGDERRGGPLGGAPIVPVKTYLIKGSGSCRVAA